MTPERWRRVEKLYDAALAQPITNRAAFLAQACDGDDEVRAEVEMLLAQTASSSAGRDDVAAAVARSTDLVGRRIGDYQIQTQIGAGGMGEVYRAHDTRLRRDVAVKTLPRLFTGDAEQRARFDREARMLAALNHPHIGAIYGVVEVDDTPALVLELIEGETLADRIARGPIPLGESLPIARQLADALAAAHGKAIVHRDLKPANIKISAD